MFVRKFASWIQFANGTKFSRTGQNFREQDKMFANGQRSRMGRNIYVTDKKHEMFPMEFIHKGPSASFSLNWNCGSKEANFHWICIMRSPKSLAISNYRHGLNVSTLSGLNEILSATLPR